MKEENILEIIKDDVWMMNILRAARTLELPDWMIGAGFIRNKVWDYLHNYSNTEVPTADIDVIYFNPFDVSEETEEEYNQRLNKIKAANWSVKNQARMHLKHNRNIPYKNTEEALSEWVETPTCIAVRLEHDDSLTLFAPHGIDDLVHLVVRPTPSFVDNLEIFWERVKSKGWQQQWKKLKILER